MPISSLPSNTDRKYKDFTQAKLIKLRTILLKIPFLAKVNKFQVSQINLILALEKRTLFTSSRLTRASSSQREPLALRSNEVTSRKNLSPPDQERIRRKKKKEKKGTPPYSSRLALRKLTSPNCGTNWECTQAFSPHAHACSLFEY
jgi:hypothetical protein